MRQIRKSWFWVYFVVLLLLTLLTTFIGGLGQGQGGLTRLQITQTVRAARSGRSQIGQFRVSVVNVALTRRPATTDPSDPVRVNEGAVGTRAEALSCSVLRTGDLILFDLRSFERVLGVVVTDGGLVLVSMRADDWGSLYIPDLTTQLGDSAVVAEVQGIAIVPEYSRVRCGGDFDRFYSDDLLQLFDYFEEPPLPTPTPPPTPEPITNDIVVGISVRVSLPDGGYLSITDDIRGEQIGLLPQGAVVVVLEGPYVDHSGWTWWYVVSDLFQVEGYVIGHNGESILIEPGYDLLGVGTIAQVTTNDGIALELYSDLDVGSPIGVSVPYGSYVQLRDGPYLGGEFTWWYVSTQDYQEGWLIENYNNGAGSNLGLTSLSELPANEQPEDSQQEESLETILPQGDGNCDGVSPRLIVGQQGRVTPGLPNRLRAEPFTQSSQIGTIGSGTTFSVLAGPVCNQGYPWWQVDYNGTIGWTVEGGNGEYWTEPLG